MVNWQDYVIYVWSKIALVLYTFLEACTNYLPFLTIRVRINPFAACIFLLFWLEFEYFQTQVLRATEKYLMRGETMAAPINVKRRAGHVLFKSDFVFSDICWQVVVATWFDSWLWLKLAAYKQFASRVSRLSRLARALSTALTRSKAVGAVAENNDWSLDSCKVSICQVDGSYSASSSCSLSTYGLSKHFEESLLLWFKEPNGIQSYLGLCKYLWIHCCT